MPECPAFVPSRRQVDLVAVLRHIYFVPFTGYGISRLASTHPVHTLQATTTLCLPTSPYPAHVQQDPVRFGSAHDRCLPNYAQLIRITLLRHYIFPFLFPRTTVAAQKHKSCFRSKLTSSILATIILAMLVAAAAERSQVSHNQI
jgi:hypothetical protein